MIQPRVAAPAVQGQLALAFVRRPDGRTVLQVRLQRQPLQVVRAFHGPGGGALVHLHNVSGGVVDGDRLAIELELGPGAEAQVTSTGATRVYRSRGAEPPIQCLDVRVGPGALLEYVPDQLIPYAGSSYVQRTRVELAPDAGLFWWEVVAPGREARGELFAYQRLDLRFELRSGGRLVAVEHACLEPQQQPLDTALLLGPYRYMVSFYICRAGLDPARWLDLEAELADLARERTVVGEQEWGVSALPADGLVVRALCRGGRAILPALHQLWQAARQALYGRPAVPPRKVP